MLAVCGIVVTTGSAHAEEQRFDAALLHVMHFAGTDFREAEGSASSGVSGTLLNTTVNAVLRYPLVIDDDDAFVYALQYSAERYAFQELERDVDAPPAHNPRGPAFGASPSRPFETLEILRGLWTWRHAPVPGYALYLHQRIGLHGEPLRLDARWLRVGTALAFERVFQPWHGIGGGVIGLWGIGGFEPVPFLRYYWQGDPWRVSVLLPLHARIYARVSRSVELGFALEADGNRYRVDPPGLPFDNINVIYSYFGPSLRVSPFPDVFLRADVGLSGLRVIEFYLDASRLSALDMGLSPVAAVAVSFEPSY